MKHLQTLNEKLALTLITLGSLGIIQYIYFQFTPKYGRILLREIVDHEVIAEIIWTKDWSIGIAGALIGVVILFLGIMQCQIERRKVKK